MVVEEVFPGTPDAPYAQYVMLRMTAEGEIFTNTTYIRVEDADGNLLGRFGTFKANMANAGAAGCTYPNCPAILIGTLAAENLFFPAAGTTIDQLVDGQVDGGAPAIFLPVASGRVCFVASNGTTVYDCTAWGDFDCRRSGNCTQQNNQRSGDFSGNLCDLNFGVPAPGLQLGFGLDRTQFNCAAKENSVDLRKAFPHPVDNSNTTAGPDRDNDGLLDVLDCGDLDAASLYFPVETTGLQVTISTAGTMPTVVSWKAQSELAGTSARYDVVAGSLHELHNFRDFQSASCMDSGLTANSTTDTLPGLLAGEGRYFLVRTRNNCGRGTFGDSSLFPDPRDLLDDPVAGPCG